MCIISFTVINSYVSVHQPLSKARKFILFLII